MKVTRYGVAVATPGGDFRVLGPVRASGTRNEATVCLAGPFFARNPVHSPKSGEGKAIRLFGSTHSTKIGRK